MDVAPPPASRLRMQEVDDRLIVSFRPSRSSLGFLTVWLAGWTFGGVVAAFQLGRASPGEAAFLLLWLCGWVVGECFAAGVIAWKLFGRESLVVGRDALEVRKQVDRFVQTNRYDAALVHNVEAARVPHGEDEKPRKDFCLKVSYGDQTLRLGAGMGEREAEYVASVVLSRLRSRSWWSEEEQVRPRVEHDQAPPRSARRVYLLAGALVACVVITGTSLVAMFGHHASPRRAREAAPSPPPIPSPGPMPYAGPMPAPKDYSNARGYASAMTSWVLSSGPLVLVSRPRCDARVTWTHWSCTVLAGSAGHAKAASLAMRYRCESVQIGGFRCALVMPRPHG